MAFWWAIFAMICWGIAPVFAKIGLSNVNPATGLVLRTMVAAALVTSWVGFTGDFEQVRMIPLRSWFLIGMEAILATLVGDLAYYYAIKNGNVSVVTFIMSSSPLITMICAALFLGEHITSFRILGAFYIILGMLLIR